MIDEKKLLEELNQAIEEAQKADGFFMTVTRREGDTLYHYQAQFKFKPDDCILSLNEIEKLVRKNHPKTPFNIARFKPRDFK